MKNVLITNDSSKVCAFIKETLTSAGHRVVAQTKFGSEANKLTKELKPDIIIIDNVLHDMFGINVLMALKKNDFMLR